MVDQKEGKGKPRLGVQMNGALGESIRDGRKERKVGYGGDGGTEKRVKWLEITH